MRALAQRSLATLGSRRSQVLVAVAASAIAAAAPLLIAHPALVLVACLAPLGLLAVVAAPFPLCLGFLAFTFFRLHEALPQLYPLKLPQLLALATLASLAWGFAARRVRPFWTKELSWFAAFFAHMSLGIAFATSREVSVALWTGTFIKIAIMVLAIAWIARAPAHFAATMRAFVACGIVIGAIAVWNKANGIGLVEGTRVTIGRDIGSQIGDPNDLALVLLFPASFALSLVLARGNGLGARLLGLVGFLMPTFGILATQSRGGLLGIVAIVGVFAWGRVRNKALLLAAGGVALLALFAVAGVGERVSGGAGESGIDESAMGRIYAWQAALRMAIAKPVFGVGLDAFHNNYYFFSPHWDGKNHAVHSTWLQILAEGGFVGLALFLALAWRTFRLALANARAAAACPSSEPARTAMAQALLAGLIGFFVSGTFLTMGYAWPFYILFALSLGLGAGAPRPATLAAEPALVSR
ncbi:MAG: O-antigen ligase family protein [Alphaproteobacteria bacterium]|nr:O-antigen ligase family protein [Alphaproteobacteria bacterium]